MKKKLKNVSGSDLNLADIGKVLATAEELEVNECDICTYIDSADTIQAIQDGNLQVGYGTTYYTNALESELFLKSTFDDDAFLIEEGSISTYTPEVETDTNTGIKGTTLFLGILALQRELYNATTNPIYDSAFQPLLGSEGREQEHINRTAILENIHSKLGWHQREITQNTYLRPKDLLIYYGWMNSFNYGVNGWSNEKVAQDMAKYHLIVLGNGIQDPSHGDYSNTQVIIPRIQALNPYAKIFGYVSVNQTYSNFQTKVDQWDTLQVDGIFMDEAGYDYGSVSTNGRVAFNQKVDYVHGKTYSNICFVNAWNMDHIIGTENDPSYPNTTWNSSEIESTLIANDWYLLESFPINTTTYSGTGGYESKSDWAARGVKATGHRYTYGINLAGSGVINNDNAGAQDLFEFQFISSCMFALEANGTSDTGYGSGSSTVTMWTRLDLTELGRIWSISPAVQLDNSDSDVYHRYVDFGRFSLDFSSGAEDGEITKW